MKNKAAVGKKAKPFTLSAKARIVPREKRREFPPEAFEPRNIKVRITMYVDSDVLEAFKARAAKRSMPYQSLVNAELRRIVETSTDSPDTPESVTAKLKQARTLIDTAIRAQRTQ